jgi:DNA-binding NtrC family response regulator
VLRDEQVPARAPLTADEIVDAMGGVDFPLGPAVAGASAAPGAPRPGGAGGPEPPTGDGPALPEKVAALERAEILSALRAARGVKARAARALGISRPTLDKKIADLGIDVWADGAGRREAGDRP